MAILYRSFRPGDEIPVVALWNRVFPKDQTNLEAFFEVVLCNFHFDPNLFVIATEHEEIVGMVHGTPDRESGVAYLHFFGVSEARRGNGIGTKLLKRIKEEFAKRECYIVRIADFPYSYIIPGVDVEEYQTGIAFLERRGFRSVDDPVSMELNLEAYHYPDKVQEKRTELRHAGYDLVPYSDEYFPHLLSQCNEHLQRDWQFTFQRAYLQKRLAQRGHLCLSNTGDEGKILVGFSFFGIVTDDIARFGPIGVSPEHRGMAIGELLMHECLQSQKELGASVSYFLWSYEDNPAGRMYKKAGFTVARRMSVMSDGI